MKSIDPLCRALLQQRTRMPRHRIVPLKKQQNSLFHSNPFVIFDEFNRLVGGALGNRTSLTRWVEEQPLKPWPRIWQPRLDLRENPDNTITAVFELPGLRKEDVSIELHGNFLTIRGGRSLNLETSDAAEQDGTSQLPTGSSSDGATQASGNTSGPTYIVRERHYGSFSRSIPVPEGTDPESVKASVENGILTVTFPKAKPEDAPKRIEVS